MFNYNKVVYVAGKFQNNDKNKKYIEECCRRFANEYPNTLFINGVSEFAHFYDYTDMNAGIKMCVAFMKRVADEVWTVGEYDDSIGTYCEVISAELLDIPVKEHMDKELNER